MAFERKKSKLEKLGENIYSPNFKDRPVIGRLEEGEQDVPDQWSDIKNSPAPAPSLPAEPPSGSPMIKRILTVSFLFFLAAVAFALLYLYRGANMLSTEKVDILVEGPVSVSGGEELSFAVAVTNRNETPIESAELLIEYPEGAYASADATESLQRSRISLGAIGAGQSAREIVTAILFGEANTERTLRVKLEFRFAGSSATLEKEVPYRVKITSSPVDVEVETLKEANAGQEFEVAVRLRSNSSSTLKDLLLSVDYPFGFRFKEASPQPLSENKVWNVGDLASGGERVIRIRGSIEGQNDEEKIFRAYVGTENPRSPRALGIVYTAVSKSIFLKKPFLALDIVSASGTGRSGDIVVPGGKLTRVDILWSSNLPTRIIDGSIEVKIRGEALDRFSISPANGGFYRSSDDTVIWKSTSGNQELAEIDPGEQGSVSLSFGFLPLVSGGERRALLNPEVTLEVTARGKRVSETDVPEEINTILVKKVRVETRFSLGSRIVYSTGPFRNTGSLPPKAEQPTTYTIIWAITNSSNAVSNATVRTTLPSYVKWLGAVSPEKERISYNEIGGEVVWNAGSIPAGAGITGPAREVAFQISFLPSITQINKSPLLTSEAMLTGTDDFTKSTLRDVKPPLSIKLTTDPAFTDDEGFVTP